MIAILQEELESPSRGVLAAAATSLSHAGVVVIDDDGYNKDNPSFILRHAYSSSHASRNRPITNSMYVVFDLEDDKLRPQLIRDSTKEQSA